MEHHQPDHKPEPVKKSGCSSCEHCHEESSLPQEALVAAAGVLTGIGLLLGWLHISPSWLGTAAFALATLAGGLLVFPAAWKALLKGRLDMNVLMTVAVTGAWLRSSSSNFAESIRSPSRERNSLIRRRTVRASSAFRSSRGRG